MLKNITVTNRRTLFCTFINVYSSENNNNNNDNNDDDDDEEEEENANDPNMQGSKSNFHIKSNI